MHTWIFVFLLLTTSVHCVFSSKRPNIRIPYTLCIIHYLLYRRPVGDQSVSFPTYCSNVMPQHFNGILPLVYPVYRNLFSFIWTVNKLKPHLNHIHLSRTLISQTNCHFRYQMLASSLE